MCYPITYWALNLGCRVGVHEYLEANVSHLVLSFEYDGVESL